MTLEAFEGDQSCWGLQGLLFFSYILQHFTVWRSVTANSQKAPSKIVKIWGRIKSLV